MKINVTYDASATGAPAGFTDAVNAAIAYYEGNFDAPVTINITIGWGTAVGSTIPDGAVGATYAPNYYFNYEEIRNAYWANARTGDTLTAAMNLPSADPTNGGTFAMTSAQAKALGLVPGRDTDSDGIIVMDPTATYTFDPNNRQVAGKIDAIGVLEHEIGHVLGRISVLGEPLPGGSTLYGALDLFRYSAPSVRAAASGTAFFSVDGQNLQLPFNDPGNGGTESDWSISLTGDVFQAFVDEGELLQFSPTDKTMLDLFGYHPHQAVPTTPVLGVPPISTVILANGAQIAPGQLVYFNDFTGYTLTGSATNAGTILNDAGATGNSVFGTIAVNTDKQHGAPRNTVFTNTSTGVVMSAMTGYTTTTAMAFDYLGAPTILNSGLIQAVSTGGDAVGFASDSNWGGFTNTASGVLRVWGKYNAKGVWFQASAFDDISIGDGAFNNAGLIEVYGDNDPGDPAHGIVPQTGATGVIGGSTFNNSGTIKAISGYGDTPSVGVLIWHYVQPRQLFSSSYTNSGTIIADYAFSDADDKDVSIVNSGKLIGSIALGIGNDEIHNTGIIAGNIYFGNSNNLYDGAGGHLYGNIWLGFGTNTVNLSADGNTVYGGGFADTVNGGAGNDSFMISRGINQLDGKGGYNTLSLQGAAGAYTVDMGAGTAVGAGTTTFANIQRVLASGFGDTLIAGNSAAFLIGGAGADILRGGAGADTLVAGAGGDSLTGNGGNDIFIYTAGDQQVTITDFRANGNADVLKIFGYASALSTQQQGADTLITLSGGDKIFLTNVLASSLGGGAVVYDADYYFPTPTSLPPYIFGSHPQHSEELSTYWYYLDGDLKIYANEHFAIDFGPPVDETFFHPGHYGFVLGATDDFGEVTTLDNFGHITAVSDGGGVSGLYLQEDVEEGSVFTNEVGASFIISNASGDAYGVNGNNLSTSSVPNIVNKGEFKVTATGTAFRGAEGVILFDHSFSFTNTATGTFDIKANTAWAYGLELATSGNFRNDGHFNVWGKTVAYGVYETVYSSLYSTINNGDLTVSGGAGAETYGFYFRGGDARSAAPIINTGTITAKTAFKAASYNPGYSLDGAASLDIQNTGTINGDIILPGSVSRIKSTGAINGNILISDDFALTFGPGARGQTIDLRGGTFNGYIAISPGMAGDVAIKDVIYTGAATTTVKIAGGQSNLAATIRANRTGHTTVEYDMASNGATWAAKPDGSIVVSAGAHGTQTLYNVESLKFTNTTVALSYSSGWSGYTGDFTGDHKADILWQQSDGTTQLWQSESHGKVASSTASISLDLDTTEILGVADYNGDGRADLLLRDILSGAVSDQLMNGAMAGASKSLGIMDSSWSVRGFGDTGGDGKADILWQKSDGTVVLWQMSAAGTIGSTANLGVVSMATWSLSNLADYNGDGKADVLLRNANGTVYNWLMNGGSIVGSNSLGTMDSAWSVKGTGDFGGDGKSDILWQKSDGTTVIWQMNSAGGLASSTNLGVLDPTVWSIPGVADYNGDGKADILLRKADDTIANWLMNGAAIVGSNNLGAIASPAVAPPPPTRNDFGGDGRADILWQDSDGTGVLWQMSSAGAIASNTSLGVINASFIGIGDYNGDGKADILLRDANGAVTVKLMNGATVSATNNISTLTNVWSVKGSGDFNGDGITDILWQKSDGTAMVWQMTSSGTLAANPILGVLPDWSLSTGGDFNGDGKADILLRNANGSAANWLMNGTSIIGSNLLAGAHVMDGWSVKGMGDFNGDGQSDILWQKSDGTVLIWRMNSNGGVISNDNLGVLPDWSLANVADYNGDGKADILLRNNNGTVANWLMDGSSIVGSNNFGTIAASLNAIPGTRRPPTANDFGGDGGADLLWHKADGSVVLWQTNAGGGFGSAATVATGLSPLTTSLVAVGDYNGDGKADFVTRDSNMVAVFFMNGATIANSLALVSGAMDTAFQVRGSGDFNGDGVTDILWQKENGSAIFWLMDGTGHIGSSINLTANTQFVSVGDYNGDGKTDILTRNSSGAVAAWLMNGVTATSTMNLGVMDSSWSVNGSGDFNGDGRADILWQKSDGATYIWQMNAGSSNFSVSNLGTFVPATWSISAGGDYNGDGKTDILLRKSDGTAYNWLMNGAAIIGSNSLGAMASSALAVPSPYVMPVPIVFKPNDFGGDGRADQLWHKADGTVVLWQTNANGGQGSETTVTSVSPAVSSLVGVGDYNGDGKADVLVRNANATVAVWLMNGATIAGTVNQSGVMDSSWTARGSGDFNGDGRTDILWQKTDGSAAFWFMDGSGANSTTTTTTVTTQFVSVGDYNGDGKADILTRDGNGAVSDWLMDGATKTTSIALGTMDSSWSVKGSGDFGGDGKADMLWQKTDGTVVIWQMNAGGGIASVSNLGVVDPTTWSISVGGDYNGDGKADILLRNANGTAYNWLMNGGTIIGSNNFGAMASSALALPAPYVLPAPVVSTPNDFGGDGRADQLWHKADGSIVLWQTNSNGGLGIATTITTISPSVSSLVGVGDYNGDGKADVLVQNANGSVVAWLMNGATIAGTKSQSGTMDSSWTVRGSGDFNGDGRADILWQKIDGSTAFWLMDGTGANSSTNTTTYNTQFVSVGDYNGDGKADILTRDSNGAMNIWLSDWDQQTGYKKTASINLGIIDSSWSVKGSGDFGGDGKADILWQKSDGAVMIWQMNGSGIASSTNLGTFDPSTWSFSVGGDYNSDGKADILLRNANGNAYNWLMNGGSIVGSNGPCAMPSSALAVPAPYIVPAPVVYKPNDFGGDGRADQLWHKADGSVVLWQTNAGGGLGSATTITTISPSVSSIVGVGDYNGDGKADFLTHDASGTAAIVLMNGASIAGAVDLHGLSLSWAYRGSGDFDGDGRTDILWQNSDGQARIWRLNGGGQIAGVNTFTIGSSNGSFLSTGDYNGDGRADILTRDANGVVSAWVTGTWDPDKGYTRAVSASLGTMDGSWSVKGSGDFGGDGIADILWQKSDGTAVSWQMNSIGHIASSINLGTFDPATWSFSVGGDYNGDGKADILLRKADGTVYNWLMNGGNIVGSNNLGAMASSAIAVPTLLPDGPRAVASDFDIDGYSDILWHKSDGTVVIWRMNSAGAIGSTVSQPNVNPALTTIGGIGDYTGNGVADIILHNSDNSVTAWFMSNSAIGNSLTSATPMSSSFSVIGTGDFTGDDRADIVWDDPNSPTATLWVINASGAPSPFSIAKSGASILGVAADFNGDRQPDLLVRNPNGTISSWSMSLNNILSSTTLGTMDSSWSIKGLGDFGGDGRTDILWQKNDGTTVIWQSGGGSVASSTTMGVFSDWSFAGVGDYNGDGKSDILLRNTVNGTVANWLMNGANIIGANNLGVMNNSWTAITR